jgi:hypothetical protein
MDVAECSRELTNRSKYSGSIDTRTYACGRAQRTRSEKLSPAGTTPPSPGMSVTWRQPVGSRTSMLTGSSSALTPS